MLHQAVLKLGLVAEDHDDTEGNSEDDDPNPCGDDNGSEGHGCSRLMSAEYSQLAIIAYFHKKVNHRRSRARRSIIEYD